MASSSDYYDVSDSGGNEEPNKDVMFKELKEKIIGRLPEIEDVDESKSPFVVLVGNVGVGKSTITEKLTGKTGLSSAASTTKTVSTEYFWVADKSLLIADTPGSNPRKRRFEHNLEIAAALNYKKVSKLLIAVKAEVRMDQTLDGIKEYADRFVHFPEELVSVIVTHMDSKKAWEEEDMKKACTEDFGIEEVVFSQPSNPRTFLQKSILKICAKTPALKIDIDSKIFLKTFNFRDGSSRRVLQLTSDIVDRFKEWKGSFEKEKKKFNSTEQVDLFFQYKAFMERQVEECKKEFCNKLGFDFCKDEETNIQHAAYVTNMVNQIRAIIHDIRMEALKYQNDHGTSDLRECPHCGKIWARFQGCEGFTTCGDLPTVNVDVNRDVLEMTKFSFKLVLKEKMELQIAKNGTEPLETNGRLAELQASPLYTDPKGVKTIKGKRFLQVKKKHLHYLKDIQGCFHPINWAEMKKIETPDELREPGKANVDDIMPLPESAKIIYDVIDRQLKAKAVFQNKK